MTKIVVAGDAVVVTSAMKLEDLRTIKKYRPNALTLKNEETGEPVFMIDVVDGKGSINKFGASFGSETRDDDKLATITLIASDVVGDIKECVADKLGAAITNLNILENTLPVVLNEIGAEKARILDSITIAQ